MRIRITSIEGDFFVVCDYTELDMTPYRMTLAVWFVLSLAVIGVLNYTNPDDTGPTGITGFFVLLYFWLFASSQLIVLRLGRSPRFKRLVSGTEFAVAATLAGIPTVILGLQSLEQLALRDVVIILSLAGIMIFYWLRRGHDA